MKYLFPFISLFLILAGCSNPGNDEPSVFKSSSVKASAGYTSAVLSANIKAPAAIVEAGFLLSEDPGMAVDKTNRLVGTISGDLLSIQLTDLSIQSKYYFSVYIKTATDEFTDKSFTFSTLAPVSSISPRDSVGVMERLTIKGSANKNSVVIGGKKATFAGDVDGGFQVFVPEGLPAGSVQSISFKAGADIIQDYSTIKIKKWSTLATLPFNTVSESDVNFTYLNDSMIYTVNMMERRLSIYDPKMDSWTQQESAFPSLDVYRSIYFHIGEKYFVGLGCDKQTQAPEHAWYQYNAQSQTVTPVDTFPGYGYGYDMATFCSGANRGYVGLGNDKGKKIKEFWSFNPTDNTWARYNDYPGTSYFSNYAFEIGSSVYVGPSNFTDNTFWKLDINTNKWKQLTSYPGPLKEPYPQHHSVFVLGMKAYLIDGNQIWVYDTTNDNWSKYKEVIPGSATRTNALAFLRGTTLFVGGGNYNSDFYRIELN